MTENEEFYIGWENTAPSAVGKRTRVVVGILLGLMVALGVILPRAQRTIGESVFEWGQVKSFSGIFQSQPYPHLLVARPGTNASSPTFSSYCLVKPLKFGLNPTLAASLDGKSVNLTGTLIYRDQQTMIEVVDDSIRPADSLSPPRGQGQGEERQVTTTSLGQQTFVGEIVDSKCYLGVMNPGVLIPHRACAIRCISGGIPPVLLVRRKDGPPLCFLLVSRDGQPVNKDVLSMVAEPVTVTGEVERQGEWLILRADPATYRRMTP